ncbi:MAG: DUF5808 domain-containing protein [Bacteroidota bacterium]|nr:DUF5808 domain-containing protein [Bacteroidota bacterium]
MESEKKSIWKRLIVNDPEDRRAIVPKRIGIGYTINFGSTRGKLVFLGLIIFILVMIILQRLGKI